VTPDPRFRRLLRLYPRELRTQRDDELVRFLRRQRSEPRYRNGSLGGLLFFLDVGVDAVRARRVLRSGRRASPGAMLADDLRRDVAYAGRTLLRAPGFAVCALSLALAVGATAAVLSTVDWLLHRSAGGVQEPDRVFAIQVGDAERPELGAFGLSFPQYLALRDVQDAFEDIAAYAKLVGVMSSESGADQVVYEYVSGSYFPLLGLRPALGRLLERDDDVEGAPPVAVLSHAFWRSRFGGDPAVLERPVRLNGQWARVIGVAPEDFEGYNMDWNGPTSVWVPVHAGPALGVGGLPTSTGSFFRLLGRLRPELSADTDLLRERAQVWLPELPPLTATAFRATTLLITESREMRIARRPAAARFLGALTVVSTLILLAACFNVANFFLGRALARRRELAIREALGASLPRLLRQLGTEAAALGIAAATLGVAGGVALAHLLATFPSIYLGLPTTAIPLSTAGAVDGRLVGVVLVLCFGAALAFGFLPALLSFRAPMSALKNATPQWTWSRVRVTPRQAVLVLQVALSVVLAVTAGLYARSFARVAGADPGLVDPASILVAKVLPRGISAEDGNAFHDALMERLNAMPEVESATIGMNAPFMGGLGSFSLPGSEEVVRAGSTRVGPGFFSTEGVPMLAGREFRASGEDQPEGAVINHVLAAALWPDADPVGRTLVHSGVERTVLGVAAMDRCNNLLDEPEPCSWALFARGTTSGYLRIRTRVDPLDLVPLLRALVRELNPDVAIAEETAMDAYVARTTAAQRGSALASLGLALFGIVLLAVGCASLFLTMVKDSVREIAIRMALGATHGRLSARILRQGLVLIGAGAVAGAGAARMLAGRIADHLYELQPTDPVTFVAAPLLIALVGAAAVGYAALVATRTLPAEHLQAE
jgi:putative ABC transport system permease protein